MGELNNPHLKNQWYKEETTREIRKYLETNKNRNTRCQNSWYAAKSVLRKVYSVNFNIKKDEIDQ